MCSRLGDRERVVGIGLALSYVLLRRASKQLMEDGGRVHEVYCLRRGSSTLFDGATRCLGTEWKRQIR